MLKLSNISMYLGYLVSVITFICGIVIVSGLVLENVPNQLRIMFGVVLILWGIYRFVITWTRKQQQNENNEE